MPAALQTPVRHRDAKAMGPRVFRKQLLPFDRIDYKGREIVFDRDYCQQLVDSFEQGTFPQVPFVLVDPETNRHVNDPERFRGEVKGFELAGDGLDAIIELSDEGAKIVRDNPRLGVSARILEDVERADGRRARLAIQHVAGTLDPEIGGLREWQTLSDLSATYGSSGQVVDLTSTAYSDERMADATDTQPEQLSAAELKELRELKEFFDSDEFKELAELLNEPDGESETDPAAGDPKDEPTADAETETETERETATLSAEYRRKVDLAASEAKTAREENARLKAKLAEADFLNEKRDLAGKGVPPAAIDLARPLLESSPVIELSAGERVDAGKIARDLLKQMEGMVDLSGERGSAVGQDADDAVTERLHKALDERFGPRPGVSTDG